jgi:TonB family protein
MKVDGASASENTFIIDGQEVTSTKTGALAGKSKTISGGVLNGRATALPKPEYPAAAIAVNADGPVVVQLVINGDGSVASATAVSGHPLLRPAAEKAARDARFTPVLLSGKPVRVTGVVTYNFGKGGRSRIRFKQMKVAAPTPAEMRSSLAASKLHFWLFALVGRLQKGETSPTPNESSFVHNGKADIQVELSSRSADVMKKLAAAGFELVAEKGNTAVIGRIELDKLATLAEIDEVRLVLPKM